MKQALISLWSALLPSLERQHLRQRLAWQPRTIEASWALAAVQVGLGPVWFLRGLAYTHILFYLSTASRVSTGHNCVVDTGWILE